MLNKKDAEYSRRVIAAGAAGFIGTNFLIEAAARHPDVLWICFDCLTYAANLEGLDEALKAPNVRFFKGDVRTASEIERAFSEFEATDVVNFAAESHVDTSIRNPGAFVQTNVVGTHNLLQTSLEFWKRAGTLASSRFHQISTDEVFGSASEGFFTEDSPIAPRSPYSASKASADAFVLAYHETFGLNSVVTNCSNNYGPRQHEEKLIPKIIKRALAGRRIPIYGSGRQIRDWLYVSDHVRAIEAVFFNADPGSRWLVGGRCEKTNLEVAAAILSELERRTGRRMPFEELVEHVEDRPGHDFRYAVDPSKLERVLGVRPQTSFAEGISRTVEWYLSRMAS